MSWMPLSGALSTVVLVAACSGGPVEEVAASESQPSSNPHEDLRVEVIESYPHDPQAYTQGLLWYGGHLYESTGQYGQSTVRKIDLESGESLATGELSSDLFGEGLARVDDRLVQLTWRAGTALHWSLESLSSIGEQRYEGEGWGLCFDGRYLVMSDGSSVLTFRDPETFEVVRQVEVTLGDGVVGRLNELECAEGWIYANVYTTDWIVRIDPESARVEALIDASGLLSNEETVGVDVLNGIAYDDERQIFFLTGKLWPRLFAVRFVDRGR